MCMADRGTRHIDWAWIVVGIVLVAFSVFWLHSALPIRSFPFILARYVDELRAGNGLVFNPGERILLVNSPAYLIIIAFLSLIFSPPTAFVIIFVVATFS